MKLVKEKLGIRLEMNDRKYFYLGKASMKPSFELWGGKGYRAARIGKVLVTVLWMKGGEKDGVQR